MKKKEYCVPNKIEARMQECKCVTGCYKEFGCKNETQKTEELNRHNRIQFIQTTNCLPQIAKVTGKNDEKKVIIFSLAVSTEMPLSAIGWVWVLFFVSLLGFFLEGSTLGNYQKNELY